MSTEIPTYLSITRRKAQKTTHASMTMIDMKNKTNRSNEGDVNNYRKDAINGCYNDYKNTHGCVNVYAKVKGSYKQMKLKRKPRMKSLPISNKPILFLVHGQCFKICQSTCASISPKRIYDNNNNKQQIQKNKLKKIIGMKNNDIETTRIFLKIITPCIPKYYINNNIIDSMTMVNNNNQKHENCNKKTLVNHKLKIKIKKNESQKFSFCYLLNKAIFQHSIKIEKIKQFKSQFQSVLYEAFFLNKKRNIKLFTKNFRVIEKELQIMLQYFNMLYLKYIMNKQIKTNSHSRNYYSKKTISSCTEMTTLPITVISPINQHIKSNTFMSSQYHNLKNNNKNKIDNKDSNISNIHHNKTYPKKHQFSKKIKTKDKQLIFNSKSLSQSLVSSKVNQKKSYNVEETVYQIPKPEYTQLFMNSIKKSNIENTINVCYNIKKFESQPKVILIQRWWKSIIRISFKKIICIQRIFRGKRTMKAFCFAKEILFKIPFISKILVVFYKVKMEYMFNKMIFYYAFLYQHKIVIKKVDMISQAFNGYLKRNRNIIEEMNKEKNKENWKENYHFRNIWNYKESIKKITMIQVLYRAKIKEKIMLRSHKRTIIGNKESFKKKELVKKKEEIKNDKQKTINMKKNNIDKQKEEIIQQLANKLNQENPNKTMIKETDTTFEKEIGDKNMKNFLNKEKDIAVNKEKINDLEKNNAFNKDFEFNQNNVFNKDVIFDNGNSFQKYNIEEREKDKGLKKEDTNFKNENTFDKYKEIQIQIEIEKEIEIEKTIKAIIGKEIETQIIIAKKNEIAKKREKEIEKEMKKIKEIDIKKNDNKVQNNDLDKEINKFIETNSDHFEEKTKKTENKKMIVEKKNKNKHGMNEKENVQEKITKKVSMQEKNIDKEKEKEKTHEKIIVKIECQEKIRGKEKEKTPKKTTNKVNEKDQEELTDKVQANEKTINKAKEKDQEELPDKVQINKKTINTEKEKAQDETIDKVKVNEKTINSVNEKTINKEKEMTTNKEKEKNINNKKENTINKVKENAINKEKEKIINQEKEKTINQKKEKTTNQEKEKSTNQEKEKNTNQEKEKYTNQQKKKNMNHEKEKNINQEKEKSTHYVKANEKITNKDNDKEIDKTKEKTVNRVKVQQKTPEKLTHKDKKKVKDKEKEIKTNKDEDKEINKEDNKTIYKTSDKEKTKDIKKDKENIIDKKIQEKIDKIKEVKKIANKVKVQEKTKVKNHKMTIDKDNEVKNIDKKKEKVKMQEKSTNTIKATEKEQEKEKDKTKEKSIDGHEINNIEKQRIDKQLDKVKKHNTIQTTINSNNNLNNQTNLKKDYKQIKEHKKQENANKDNQKFNQSVKQADKEINKQKDNLPEANKTRGQTSQNFSDKQKEIVKLQKNDENLLQKDNKLLQKPIECINIIFLQVFLKIKSIITKRILVTLKEYVVLRLNYHKRESSIQNAICSFICSFFQQPPINEYSNIQLPYENEELNNKIKYNIINDFTASLFTHLPISEYNIIYHQLPQDESNNIDEHKDEIQKNIINDCLSSWFIQSTPTQNEYVKQPTDDISNKLLSEQIKHDIIQDKRLPVNIEFIESKLENNAQIPTAIDDNKDDEIIHHRINDALLSWLVQPINNEYNEINIIKTEDNNQRKLIIRNENENHKMIDEIKHTDFILKGMINDALSSWFVQPINNEYFNVELNKSSKEYQLQNISISQSNNYNDNLNDEDKDLKNKKSLTHCINENKDNNNVEINNLTHNESNFFSNQHRLSIFKMEKEIQNLSLIQADLINHTIILPKHNKNNHYKNMLIYLSESYSNSFENSINQNESNKEIKTVLCHIKKTLKMENMNNSIYSDEEVLYLSNPEPDIPLLVNQDYDNQNESIESSQNMSSFEVEKIANNKVNYNVARSNEDDVNKDDVNKDDVNKDDVLNKKNNNEQEQIDSQIKYRNNILKNVINGKTRKLLLIRMHFWKYSCCVIKKDTFLQKKLVLLACEFYNTTKNVQLIKMIQRNWKLMIQMKK